MVWMCGIMPVSKIQPEKPEKLESSQKRAIHTIPNPSQGTPYPTMPAAAGPADRRHQPSLKLSYELIFF